VLQALSVHGAAAITEIAGWLVLRAVHEAQIKTATCRRQTGWHARD
jgi:hypothetical protein